MSNQELINWPFLIHYLCRMALLFHNNLQPEGELGVWKIEEDESYFLERMQLRRKEHQQLVALKGNRRLEWLASRWLLHRMSGRRMRGACIKDEHGKPYLTDSLFDISISHSRELVSVIAAPRSVGVDIQKIVEKIERISYKFMREPELFSLRDHTRLEHLHVYWGAKEALYKAYGLRELDFREHIFIDPFGYDSNGGIATGHISKGDFLQFYTIRYQMVDHGYMLVYAMEDVGDLRLA